MITQRKDERADYIEQLLRIPKKHEHLLSNNKGSRSFIE